MVGPRCQRIRLVAEAEVVGDTVDRDPEQGGHRRQRADAAVDGVDDAAAEFDGVSSHSKALNHRATRKGAIPADYRTANGFVNRSKFKAHDENIAGVAITPDGKRFLTGSND